MQKGIYVSDSGCYDEFNNDSKGGEKMNHVVPRMVTLRKAADMTGLSYDFLRKLCLRNEIAYIRSGSKYMVNVEKLCDYLNRMGEIHE